MKRLVAAVATLAAVAVGCTSGADPAPPTTSTEFRTITQTRSPSSTPTPTPTPIPAGPTNAATRTACPYLDTKSAAGKVGMRLEDISVLTSAGKTVGCRFYAEHGTPYARSEHLPPPSQPVIEITSYRYASAADAHNAFVVLAAHRTSAQQATITTGNTGLCYQESFYAKDHGMDWACTYSVGATRVLVRTVVTTPSFNAIQIAKAVAGKF